MLVFIFFFSHTSLLVPASGQAEVTGVVPPPPLFLLSIFVTHRVQQSHCLSIFHRVLLTRALALSASQFVTKKKSPRTFTSMYSGGYELSKLTYSRLDDNLKRHRGDRFICACVSDMYVESMHVAHTTCVYGTRTCIVV